MLQLAIQSFPKKVRTAGKVLEFPGFHYKEEVRAGAFNPVNNRQGVMFNIDF